MLLHVTARPRSTDLELLVKSFHHHEGELAPAVERILPTSQAYLMVNLAEDEFRTYGGQGGGIVHRTSGAVLAGPHGQSAMIDTQQQRRLIAVEFTLGGVAALLGMPVSEVCNQVIELDNVWGRDGSVLRERLCEAPPTPAAEFRVLEAFHIFDA